jgi:hypothetical protein
MITSTSLQHPKMQWDLLAMTMQVVEQSFNSPTGSSWVELKNKRGEVSMLIRHSRVVSSAKALRYFDCKMNDITDTVLKALRK